LFACDFKSKPYLKQDLAYEKIAGDCYGQDSKISIDANTIGERYVFQECLSEGYKGEYEVKRKGDTVEVRVPRASEAGSLYRITLDINTRPAYHFLTINGETLPVVINRY
jgi:hypothetical protein